MKAVLDANVLFPTILREILTDLAKAGLFQPFWSERILSEWRHAAARLGGGQDQIAGAEIALLRLAFPDAVVADDGDRAIDLNFPDPADRHVVEAAIAVGAGLIITANLRDFPQYLMQPLGIRAIHPDAFLLDLWRDHADCVGQVVTLVHEKATSLGSAMSVAEMLKRSRLPRLNKALKG